MLGLNIHWIYAHFIGDYLLQTDWVATNKKNNTLVCIIHVTLYCIPFLLTNVSWIQLILIAIQHFIQDRSTFIQWYCKINRMFQRETSKFWGHIIVDNIFHALWILIVTELL